MSSKTRPPRESKSIVTMGAPLCGSKSAFAPSRSAPVSSPSPVGTSNMYQ